MADQQGGKEALFIDARMNPTGYEETELTYNVPEEISAADKGQKGGGFEEEGIETEYGLDGVPLPGPSKRNTGTV